ncbi:hypothetical protein D3C87_1531480 [compost metagenome]
MLAKMAEQFGGPGGAHQSEKGRAAGNRLSRFFQHVIHAPGVFGKAQTHGRLPFLIRQSLRRDMKRRARNRPGAELCFKFSGDIGLCNGETQPNARHAVKFAE